MVKKLFILLCLCSIGIGSAWGAEWTHAFVSPEAISKNAITISEATWSVSTTTGAGSPAFSTGTYSGTYGLKFGNSKSVYFGSVTFTTSYFTDKKVKSVKCNLLNNGSKEGTLTARQGDVNFSPTSKTFGTSWNDLTVSGEGNGGDLSITYSVAQAFYLHQITVTYENKSSETFTVTFNPGTNGTCATTSLTEASAGIGVTLPACTANEGYVFKGWAEEGGNVVGQAGDTYKPGSNCTLNAVYNALYTLTITQPADGGTLTVTDGTNALATGAKVEAGTKLTCEVTDIPEGKRFSRFYVKYEGGEKYKSTNPATFDNIPTDITAATVTVAYQDLAICSINYMVNGVNTDAQENVYEGTALEFPTVGELGGKVFVGWSESEVAETDVKPTLVNTTNLTATTNATYYAVFATQEGVASTDYSKITSIDALTDNIYVFAYDYNGGTQIVMQNETNSTTKLKGYDLSLTDSKYNNPEAKYIWQINKVVEEEQTYYTIYNAAVNKYVKGNSTGLTLADEPFNFIVAYDGTNNCFRFQSSTATTYYLHGYVSGSSYDFRSSTSGKGASYHVNLYKNESTTSFSDYTTFVGYTREVTNGNLGSICLPCDAEVEGATLYEISAITMDDVNANYIKSISFSSVEGAEAGKGYVFKASDSKLIAYYSGSAVENVEANNGIIGNLSASAKTVSDTQYIISGNTVKRSNGSATVGQNRAYIDPAQFEAPESAKTADFTIDFDTPTAINEVFDKINAEGQWYSIKGEKVARPTTGVFVKNGVKYIFK